ncbi:MAG TPA: hypothetical protein VL860_03815 [Planctomycetota bacterium]|nr:hypothetical protein [Planctomycetota bacterium]
MTHSTPEHQPEHPDQPIPGDSLPPVDARSADEKAADETVSALFRHSGLALSNGHAPAIQGADARSRAAEEEAIAAIFQSADCLLTAPGPDFRRMAVKAREIARDRGELGPNEELEGERVRSDLQQLPDLEVRCWNVSHTSSLPVETATSASPAGSATPVVVPNLVPQLPAIPVSAVAAGEPLAPVAEGLTALDAANIRENNWAEFKRRYHRERRIRILELAAAGAFGAAACFLLVWTTSPGAAARHPAAPNVASNASGANSTANADRDRNGASTVKASRTLTEDPEEAQVVPVTDQGFGADQSKWVKENSDFVGLTIPKDVQEVGSIHILVPKSESDPNPARKLTGPWAPPARPGDNAPPEVFAERGQGLRIIRINPRSDFAQAVLGVNDWITRVIKPDGSSIELSQGNEESLKVWKEFVAMQHPGDSFDVEYQRGPLIRRTTVNLTNDR